MDVLYSKGHSHKRLGQSVGRLMGSKGGGLIHAPKRGAPVSVHDIVRGRSRPLAERHGPTASSISVPAAFYEVPPVHPREGKTDLGGVHLAPGWISDIIDDSLHWKTPPASPISPGLVALLISALSLSHPNTCHRAYV